MSGHDWSGVMINPCHPGRIIIHTQHNKQQGITQMASSSERLHETNETKHLQFVGVSSISVQMFVSTELPSRNRVFTPILQKHEAHDAVPLRTLNAMVIKQENTRKRD